MWGVSDANMRHPAGAWCDMWHVHALPSPHRRDTPGFEP